MAKRDMQTVVYTDNDGNDYAMKIDKNVFTQETATPGVKIIGGSDYTGTPRLPAMPVNLIPRHVIVSNGTDKRRVICLEKTAPLFDANHAEATNDVSLQQLGSANLVYTVDRANGERWKRRGSSGD